MKFDPLAKEEIELFISGIGVVVVVVASILSAIGWIP